MGRDVAIKRPARYVIFMIGYIIYRTVKNIIFFKYFFQCMIG